MAVDVSKKMLLPVHPKKHSMYMYTRPFSPFGVGSGAKIITMRENL